MKYKMQNLRRKRALEKANVEAKSVLKDMQSLKKGMMLNRIKEMVTSGSDPTQLILQLVKEKVLRDSLYQKKSYKVKHM